MTGRSGKRIMDCVQRLRRLRDGSAVATIRRYRFGPGRVILTDALVSSRRAPPLPGRPFRKSSHRQRRQCVVDRCPSAQVDGSALVRGGPMTSGELGKE
jgi:hypothetical protein